MPQLPFLADWINWFLADDDSRSIRIGLAAGAAFLIWRAAWIAAQPKPPRPPSTALPVAEPVAPAAPTHWFPSRQERLERAVLRLKTETDLAIAATDKEKASAALAQARAELAQIIMDLTPARDSKAQRTPTLTLREIVECVELVQLESDARIQFLALITALIEEKAS